MALTEIPPPDRRAEMTSVIRRYAEELEPLVGAVLPRLMQREDLTRGYETLLRIESASRLGDDTLVDLGEVRRDFSIFTQAHILRARGVSYQEIAQRLGDDRVVHWLQREDIPFSMYRDDPTRNAHFIKRMTVPEGISGDFAYVLGAYAGTRMTVSESVQVSFQSTSLGLAEQLRARIAQACGLELHIRSVEVGPHRYFSITTRAHEFGEYLTEVSRGNTVVPWPHLQTSLERREFLRGFLDFGGCFIDVEHGRFSITRNNNVGLLEELAILLKREGIHPRVRTKKTTTLFLDAAVDLIALQRLGVVRRGDPAERLATVCENLGELRIISANDYDTVMGVARRVRHEGGISPARVISALGAAGSPLSDLPVGTIRKWIVEGGVPPSVRRRNEVAELEGKNLTPERVREIGEAILQRLPALPHPYVVVDAIAEYIGGAPALTTAAGLDPETVKCVTERKRLPSEVQYRRILAVVGLELTPRLEAGASPPDLSTVRSFFTDPDEQRAFATLSGAILVRVREAFERGEDPAVAAHQALTRARERSTRVNGWR